MDRRHRLRLLCATLSLVLLLALPVGGFLSFVHHTCEGEDCRVCEAFFCVRSLLRLLIVSACVRLICGALRKLTEAGPRTEADIPFPTDTPVGLSVRMNN